MGDEEAVRRQVQDAYISGNIIGDGTARTIATWYGSSGTHGIRFAELSTSGAITDLPELVLDCEREAKEAESHADQRSLQALSAYVKHHGERGPVEGWASVWCRR